MFTTIETQETAGIIAPQIAQKVEHDGPRIYVACLAAYNNGTLHGTWIDAEQDAETIKEEIAAMLRQSPNPNVEIACPDCDSPVYVWCETCAGSGTVPSAEEFAIHDYEGFGAVKIGEYETIENVARIAALIAEHGEVFEAAYSNSSDLDEAESAVTESFAGQYNSLEDWAEEFLNETGQLAEVPESLRCYFDFDKWASDAEMNGDIWTADNGGNVLVFWNH